MPCASLIEGACFKIFSISEFEVLLVFEKAAFSYHIILEEVLDGSMAYSEILPAFLGGVVLCV